ncbi:MAG: gliding motility-associated C-terminal domain-containing protein [Vicingaceae bacterium]
MRKIAKLSLFLYLGLQLTVSKASIDSARVTTSINSVCYDSCLGSSIVEVWSSSSTGPFRVIWKGNNLPDSQTVDTVLASDTVFNLCAGEYSVQVIDLSDLSSLAPISFTILNAPPVSVGYTSIPPTMAPNCHDSLNGLISIDFLTGSPMFHVQWSTGPNDTLSVLSGIGSGIYGLTVTDANGCVMKDSFWLKGPDSLEVNISGSDISCKGACDGSVFANPQGGTPGYHYLWNNSDTNRVLSNLCPGTFSVIVTDQNGCTSFDTLVVGEPDSLLVNFAVSDVSCKDLCDGQVTAIPSGGLPPYAYIWSAYPDKDSILNGACSGIISSTVIDANGCYVTKNVTVGSPNAIKLTPAINSSSCGICDGDITLNPSGGSGPYTYLWLGQKPEDTINSIDSLCAGAYQVVVGDAGMCIDTFTLYLSDDTSGIKDLVFSTVKPNCENNCDGAISVIALGGQAPYSYSWLPGAATDSVLTGLCPGTYSIEVTDGNLCKRIESIDLVAKSNLKLSMFSTPVSCVGSCDGGASVSVSGGSGPYSYQWNGNSAGGSARNDLCSGVQFVTVTDANMCMATDTVQVLAYDTLKLNINAYATTCASSCDGIASASVTGGLAPYDYFWSNGMSADSITNLCPGSYELTVTDALGCSVSKMVNVIGAISPVLGLTVYHSGCNLNNGGAKLNITGGSAPYAVRWQNGTTTDSIFGLSSGIYSVDVWDSQGCMTSDTFFITDLTGPTVSTAVTNESCAATCDGKIVASASGTGPFAYQWTPSFFSNPTLNSVNGLCPGSYYLSVTDGNGCRSISEQVVSPGKDLSVEFDLSPPSCNGACDAGIIANVLGGLPPYSYQWSTSSVQKGISNVCAGTYTLTVIDANACSISRSVEIGDAEPISVSLITSNLSCYDQCDGSITSIVQGGGGKYTYTWSTTANSEDISNLCEGSYWLQVADENACVASDTISIANGIPIDATFSTTPAGCGQCNGSINVSSSGGNGIPYSLLWSTGDTTNVISDLAAGIYSVEISDNQGCSQEFKIGLSNSAGPVISDTAVGESCFNSCDGVGSVNVISSQGPYSVLWNDPAMQKTDSAKNLCPSIYFYSVTDSTGCVTYDSVSVSASDELAISYALLQPTCQGSNDGSITANVTGNQGPVSFLWSTSDTTSVIDTIGAGTYWVLVNDSSGCSKTDTIELNEPAQLAVAFGVTLPSCFNSCDAMVSVQVTGGTAPYTYAWNDPGNQSSPVAFGLCPGYALVTVTDAKNCSFTDSVLVTAPSAIALTPILTNPSCLNGDNGNISVSASGGQAPFQFSWSNGFKGNSISGLEAGSYTVTAIDANQCVYQGTYILNNPGNPININFNRTLPTCNSGNGSIAAVVTGGSGNYSFIWNTVPSQTTSTATGLWAGIYAITVTDNISGCIREETVFLNNTGGPVLTSSVVNDPCPNACQGQATVHTGTGNFSYLWDDKSSQTDSTAFTLCPGVYIVRVTNNTTGCISFDTVTVGVDTFRVDVLNSKAVSCFGNCDGSALASAVGGLPPYNYSWSTIPPETTPSVQNLCGGIYSITASDSNSCSSLAAVSIHEPAALELIPVVLSDATCSGLCDGVASLNIQGGSGPYTVYWNGKQGLNIASNLCPGQNLVEVVDRNFCSVIDTIIITGATPIAANAVTINPSCGEYNGSISLTPSGGKGPYFYSWSTGESASVISGLFAGIYSVSITDVNGCSSSFTFFLNNPNAPLLSFDKNTVKCNGDCNGVARVTTIGGVSPFTYRWDHVPISTLDSLTGLCSGNYFVKVTDATGCIAFGSDTVFEPAVLDGVLNKISDGCGGLCEGEVAINPIGGTPPYNYTWNSVPPQNSSTASNLCAGYVTISLLDVNDCAFTDSLEIIPPPELLIDSVVFINASCFTNADGEATVYTSGGSAPFSYLWTDLQTTQTAVNLNNGLLAIVVTDQNNCTASDTVNIAVTDTVLVNGFVDSLACYGDEILLLANGYGATLFRWFEDSSGVLTAIGTGDSIFFTVEDTVKILLRGQNSVIPPCFDVDTFMVTGIPLPAIDAGPDVTIEQGGFAQLLASPFLFNGSYAWTPSASLNDTTRIDPIARPNQTTTYFVTGTNEYGCPASDSMTVFVVENDVVINGFSPNGDGVNDTWEIPFLKDYPNVRVEVYNRWGMVVFESNGYNQPWDGRLNGELLPGTSYYYVIDLFGDGSDVKTGALSILY